MLENKRTHRFSVITFIWEILEVNIEVWDTRREDKRFLIQLLNGERTSGLVQSKPSNRYINKNHIPCFGGKKSINIINY